MKAHFEELANQVESDIQDHPMDAANIQYLVYARGMFEAVKFWEQVVSAESELLAVNPACNDPTTSVGRELFVRTVGSKVSRWWASKELAAKKLQLVNHLQRLQVLQLRQQKIGAFAVPYEQEIAAMYKLRNELVARGLTLNPVRMKECFPALVPMLGTSRDKSLQGSEGSTESPEAT